MWVWMQLFSLILVWTIYSLYMMVDDWLVWGLYYPISWGLSQSGNPWPSVVSDCLRMGKVVTRGVWNYQLPWPFSCTCVSSACLNTETGHSLKLHVMFNVQCLHFLKIYDPLKHAIPTWIPLGKCHGKWSSWVYTLWESTMVACSLVEKNTAVPTRSWCVLLHQITMACFAWL